VIEDEETLRLAVSKMLRMEGFSVIETGDGPAGASLFRNGESRIDVVLLDASMPGMSARELLMELRQMRPDVKVILTTAHSQHHILSAMPDLHPWGYLRKPYQFAELANLIRSACADQPEVSKSAAV
jgi:CheY-like chemotaxis protein